MLNKKDIYIYFLLYIYMIDKRNYAKFLKNKKDKFIKILLLYFYHIE